MVSRRKFLKTATIVSGLTFFGLSALEILASDKNSFKTSDGEEYGVKELYFNAMVFYQKNVELPAGINSELIYLLKDNKKEGIDEISVLYILEDKFMGTEFAEKIQGYVGGKKFHSVSMCAEGKLFPDSYIQNGFIDSVQSQLIELVKLGWKILTKLLQA